MIQRIQTVYLLGILGLIILCLYFPMAELIGAAGQMDAYTLKGLTSGKAGKDFSRILILISGFIVGFTLVTIFIYKNRKRQMLFCIILIAVLLILEALIFLQLGRLKTDLGVMINYRLPVVFPLISSVLAYMAYRRIKQDEDLVKSYDRLR